MGIFPTNDGKDGELKNEENLYRPAGKKPISKTRRLRQSSAGLRGQPPRNGKRGLPRRRDQARPGAPTVQGAGGPDQSLVTIAELYAKDNGIKFNKESAYRFSSLAFKLFVYLSKLFTPSRLVWPI
ncbi:hypothetical protein Ping_1582 [Psychromonas ingrahamii 37]|uniref:Uncharacterized protein n=1 Tax=Psychromonas ingrahamii (strain DSM 17664 / CCUG 51855 / 37) TaxID=357804 RepID=A1SV66_PSYIN|nr:hypothetical protein Ping_1582 [Psychromonas ingrahamii 37]